jgi:FkbH-like protein
MEFSTLRKNLKKDFSTFPAIKVAIIGDTPTQLLHQALKGYGYEVGISFDIYEADYDQVDMQVMDSGSELYEFNPEYVILFHATQKLASKFYKKGTGAKREYADNHIAYLSQLLNVINENLKCKVIYFNFPETNDTVFGNYANKTDQSLLYQLRKLNFGLMDLARETKNLFINDVASLYANAGVEAGYSPVTYTNTGIVFEIDFWPQVVKSITDIILAITGKFKKAVVLDLDNTLWGGIIGDDGIENIQIGDLGIGRAFTELQTWLKQLKERGIILAVCSKNYEHIAMEAFEKHPDMVLRPEDIAVFVANWENKVDNIRHIQSVLNIGFDSMVYLDDNPFERNMVRTEIAALTIPELPEDPSEYLGYLQSLNLFETAAVTEEDSARTKQYQEESKRATLQKAYANEEEFLQSLDMVCEVKPFDKFNTPRVAQLSQRSNQFNLRTIRYTEKDIEQIAANPDYITLAFNLSDKFGDYGLISAVILKNEGAHIFIDTWFMSCRVLKRGMENNVLNAIADHALQKGAKKIIGEYIATPKNELVKDHYANLGFKEANGKWELNLEEFKKFKVYINTKTNGKN